MGSWMTIFLYKPVDFHFRGDSSECKHHADCASFDGRALERQIDGKPFAQIARAMLGSH